MENVINLQRNDVLKVTVICNSKTEVIEQIKDKELKVKLRALPLEGRANKRLMELFKEKGYRIEILKGEKSHIKVIKIL